MRYSFENIALSQTYLTISFKIRYRARSRKD